MKLTRNQAIDRTIELWTWLAETGKPKLEWPQWVENGGVYSYVVNLCFLCEFDIQHRGACKDCPYVKTYNIECFENGEPFDKWDAARTPRTSRKYAKEFLAKIIALREEK